MGTFRVTLHLAGATGERFQLMEALVDTGASYTWIAFTLEGFGLGVDSQFHFRFLICSRFTFPPLSTATTFDPAGALINPCNSAATGAAAAPSTTSLQCDMIQIMAAKISRSGSVTMSSTKRCTTENV